MYTTFFPAIENYVPAWYRSVLQQTDQDFDLYIGSAGRDARNETVTENGVHANWVIAADRSTPAQVRELAIREILRGDYPAIVFVDADDVLFPTRVEAAREAISNAEVAACALEIITEKGELTGHRFGPSGVPDFNALPCCNFFGLSNSVYQTTVLRRCLPVPPECVLMDWFLITRAWVSGAQLAFDSTCRMYYRQHSENLAHVLPPFSVEYVKKATELVSQHYLFVLDNIPELSEGTRKSLAAAQKRVQIFQRLVVQDERKLTGYVLALNELPPSCTWWRCVAHPELENIWKG